MIVRPKRARQLTIEYLSHSYLVPGMCSYCCISYIPQILVLLYIRTLFSVVHHYHTPVAAAAPALPVYDSHTREQFSGSLQHRIWDDTASIVYRAHLRRGDQSGPSGRDFIEGNLELLHQRVHDSPAAPPHRPAQHDDHNGHSSLFDPRGQKLEETAARTAVIKAAVGSTSPGCNSKARPTLTNSRRCEKILWWYCSASYLPPEFREMPQSKIENAHTLFVRAKGVQHLGEGCSVRKSALLYVRTGIWVCDTLNCCLLCALREVRYAKGQNRCIVRPYHAHCTLGAGRGTVVAISTLDFGYMRRIMNGYYGYMPPFSRNKSAANDQLPPHSQR